MKFMRTFSYNTLTRVEISKANLQHNVKSIMRLVGADKTMCAAIKGNAYGHGLVEVAPLVLEAGAKWLGVNALHEANALYEGGISNIYIMGYVALEDLKEVVSKGYSLVVYNKETLAKLAEVCAQANLPALTHVKLETGNYRQGVLVKDLPEFLQYYKDNQLLRLEGAATHFANIEDTTDHSYAEFQLKNFNEMIGMIEAEGFRPTYKHCANSAAAILFPQTYFNFVRTGIGNYGLWPSKETLISALREGVKIELKPVMTWKTVIAQIKDVPAGAFVGYGCTYKTSADSRLAVLPVGYYDGYRRDFSNCAYVLINGKKAPVRGRVAMNMTVVDVTDIPDAKVEDEVVLLGSQGEISITAEQLAECAGTINYEITTGINERIERRVV